MGEVRQAAPIIKRKKIVNEAGHHGGAWKVAYADFVTAMMAFFMLMWLMNATTEKQRKGLADYFSPTIAVNRISGGGDGMFGGDSVFSEDVKPRSGTGGSQKTPGDAKQSRGDSGLDARAKSDREKEEKALARAAEQLVASGGESMVADQALRHIFSRVSDQGLIVELFDLPDATLFVGDTDEPTILTIQLIKMIADIFQSTGNPIAVNGHVRARPIVARSSSGWELSVRRAQKLRMMLVSSGLHEGRMERVAGWADRKPADLDPMSVRNNRVEIILLRSDRAATGK